MPLKNDWDTGDQFTADDANDVADAVNSAYVKPGDGIPKADLVSAVQVSLGKADTAVQAVDAATISDSTSTGRAVLKATDAAAARTAIGVAYGTTSGTVAQGNDSRFSPSAAAISDSTAVGRSLLTATDAASARSAIGVAYGASGGTVCQGNDSRVVGAEQTSNKGAANGYASLDSSGKVPVTQLPTGFSRSITTITADTTLGSTANTDYIVLVGDKAASATLTLLHFNETAGTTDSFVNAGTQANWTYNSATNKPRTTTEQSKFGGLSFTGGSTNDFGGNYIKPSSAHTPLGTGDFTIEWWARHKSYGGDENQFVLGNMKLRTTGDGFCFTTDGVDRITGSKGSTNTWNHYAAVRYNGVTKLYRNGTQTGSSYTDTNNYTSTEPQLGYYAVGYFDDLRICDTAVYKANFTAPTSELGIANKYTPAVPTLPNATVVGTNNYIIRNNASASVTIGVTSSQLVNGASGGYALASGAVARFVSDGSNWVTL